MNACGKKPDRVDGRAARGQPTGIWCSNFQHSPFFMRPTNKDLWWSDIWSLYVCFSHGRLDSWSMQLRKCCHNKFYFHPLSFHSNHSISFWAKLLDMLLYSSSIVDLATIGCFFDAHEIAPDPIWNTYQKMLFPSSILPAQSLAV